MSKIRLYIQYIYIIEYSWCSLYFSIVLVIRASLIVALSFLFFGYFGLLPRNDKEYSIIFFFNDVAQRPLPSTSQQDMQHQHQHERWTLTSYINFFRGADKSGLLAYKPKQTKSCYLRKTKQLQNPPCSPTRPTVSLLSRPATNLSNHSLTAVAHMDNKRVSDICNDICTSLLSQMEGKLLATISTHQQHRYSGPSVAPTAASTSPQQIHTGLPGVFSPPSIQSSRDLSASAPTFAVSNTNAMTTSQNEYDKAVEVDQRKLRDT